VTTLKDNVRAQAALLRQLGVVQLAMAVGGSLGGMLALEWAAEFPAQVDSLCLIATCAQHPGWAIGLNEAARQAIYADPLWASGAYGRSASSAAPLAGMAVARQFAMLSYRTPASLDSKFGRATKAEQRPEGLVRAQGLGVQGQGQGRAAAAPPFFEVESYLNYQGEKFRERFDPLAYVRLTQLMDSHDLGRGRAVPYRQVLASMQQRALIVGIDSDLLYPVSWQLCARTLSPLMPSPLTSPPPCLPASLPVCLPLQIGLQEELHSCMPRSSMYKLSSPHGHDSFLIEIEELNRACVAWRDAPQLK
jgi:homoserine O-acetyltransferase